MRSFTLIPLRGSEWESASDANSMSIYYPHVNGYPIPTNSKLNLLDSEAGRNCDAKWIFDRLDVQDP